MRMPTTGEARFTDGLHFRHRYLFLCVYPMLRWASRDRFPKKDNGLRYLFEDCVFDAGKRELRRGDDAVSVAPQVFDLLK